MASDVVAPSARPCGYCAHPRFKHIGALCVGTTLSGGPTGSVQTCGCHAYIPIWPAQSLTTEVATEAGSVRHVHAPDIDSGCVMCRRLGRGDL